MEIDRNGFAWLRGMFNREQLDSLRRESAELLAAPRMRDSLIQGGDAHPTGARNLLDHWPSIVEWVRQSPIATVLRELLGDDVGCVRGLYFDKPPGQGWALPWHRDQVIAVAKHGVMGTFRKPTTKGGVAHVEAPIELLQQMLSVRIHLDPMRRENGAIMVQPGSHTMNREAEPLMLECNTGDVLLMRPLLLHSSVNCDVSTLLHRRIIHLEFAPRSELNDDYSWKWFIKVQRPDQRSDASVGVRRPTVGRDAER